MSEPNELGDGGDGDRQSDGDGNGYDGETCQVDGEMSSAHWESKRFEMRLLAEGGSMEGTWFARIPMSGPDAAVTFTWTTSSIQSNSSELWIHYVNTYYLW